MPHHQTGPRGRWPAQTLLLLALIALGAGACGGSGDGGSRVASLTGAASGGGATTTTTVRDPEQAALDYVRCMRQHGIDMADPQTDANGRTRLQLKAGPGTDPRKLQAAERACGSLLKPGGTAKRLSPEAMDAMVKFAQCMRQHGIDMPDPSPDGGLLFRGKGGKTGAGPDSAKFKAAEQACKHYLDPIAPRRSDSR
jgi:hypothetical protein